MLWKKREHKKMHVAANDFICHSIAAMCTSTVAHSCDLSAYVYFYLLSEWKLHLLIRITHSLDWQKAHPTVLSGSLNRTLKQRQHSSYNWRTEWGSMHATIVDEVGVITLQAFLLFYVVFVMCVRISLTPSPNAVNPSLSLEELAICSNIICTHTNNIVIASRSTLIGALNIPVIAIFFFLLLFR